MKTILITIAVLAIMAIAMADKPHYDLDQAPQLFEKYVKDYQKEYKDDSDREEHYKAFIKSLNTINKANFEDGGATFDINKFSDYTDEEIKKMNGVKILER